MAQNYKRDSAVTVCAVRDGMYVTKLRLKMHGNQHCKYMSGLWLYVLDDTAKLSTLLLFQ